MRKNRSAFIPLPPPHQTIRVSVDWEEFGATIEYHGDSLAALHAAGCMDDETYSSFSTSKRRMSPNGFVWRSRMYPVGWVIRHIDYESKEALGQLPGVADYPESEPQPAFGRPSYTLDERSGYAVGMLGAQDYVKRSRCVGRFQRPATWTCIEKLIIIDWSKVKAVAAQGANAS